MKTVTIIILYLKPRFWTMYILPGWLLSLLRSYCCCSLSVTVSLVLSFMCLYLSRPCTLLLASLYSPYPTYQSFFLQLTHAITQVQPTLIRYFVSTYLFSEKNILSAWRRVSEINGTEKINCVHSTTSVLLLATFLLNLFSETFASI